MDRKQVELLGFKIDTFDMPTALDYAVKLIQKRKGGQIVTVNPEMIEKALKNKDFAEILHNSSLSIPDGVGIEIGLKMKAIEVNRIAGIEFAYDLLKKCEENKIPVAMIGARPHIILKAAKKIKEDMPNLKIVYTHNGYFSDENRVIKEAKQELPKLILVALGSPKQEQFMKKLSEKLPFAVMIGVGGSFDVWAGDVERAPGFFRNHGLEWLYRTIKEPQRFKRIFPTLPKFLLHCYLEKIFHKK